MKIPKKALVSSEIIKTIIGLFSIVLLLTGIVYNIIYLGLFGIDIIGYFTVQDYLASSLNVLMENAIIVVIGFLLYFFGYASHDKDKSVKGKIPDKIFQPNVKKPIQVIALLLPFLFMYIPGLLMIYLFNKMTGYYIIGLSIAIYITLLLQVIVHNKRRYLIGEVGYNIMLFCAFFYALIISDAFYKSDSIKKGKLYSENKPSITFEDKAMNKQSYIILSSNSNYLFLYSREFKQAMIVPVKQIKSITLKARD
jgi:hypothetical protein